MSDVELMMRTYFHRLRDGLSEDTINKLGIATRDKEGRLYDSTELLLFYIIPMLKRLIQEEDTIQLYHSINDIVGMRQRNLFIKTFLEEEIERNAI